MADLSINGLSLGAMQAASWLSLHRVSSSQMCLKTSVASHPLCPWRLSMPQSHQSQSELEWSRRTWGWTWGVLGWKLSTRRHPKGSLYSNTSKRVMNSFGISRMMIPWACFSLSCSFVIVAVLIRLCALVMSRLGLKNRQLLGSLLVWKHARCIATGKG